MSRLNISLLVIIVCLIIVAQADVFSSDSGLSSFISLTPTSPTVTPTITPSPTPTTIPTPTPIPIGVPMTLMIPRLNVNAQVQPEGVDFNGKMNMPEDWFMVAWYSLGFKPGEKGNAVLAGHLDTNTGAPALFYYLKALNVGDEVLVNDNLGRQRTFIVTGKQTYPFDQVPIDQVFGPNQDKNLNLITCTGWWNRQTHNYSDRLIVFTKMKE